jgi:hypothetical protein
MVGIHLNPQLRGLSQPPASMDAEDPEHAQDGD